MASRSLNKVMLIGNLTRDPELRYTPQGNAVCTFGLATNRSWQPAEGGERREETEFHRIVAWNKLAELCSQLLTKGRKVFVEGRLQTRSWDSPDGQHHTSTEVVIDDMMILDSRRVGEGGVVEEAVPMQPAKPVEDVTPVVEEETEETKETKGSKSAKGTKGIKGTEETEKEEVKSDEINVDDIPF